MKEQSLKELEAALRDVPGNPHGNPRPPLPSFAEPRERQSIADAPEEISIMESIRRFSEEIATLLEGEADELRKMAASVRRTGIGK
jgi:hypothetical protein